jgi:enoyl-CoA hydratase
MKEYSLAAHQEWTEIEVGRHDNALWIRLNRPAVLNTLTPVIIDEINRALDLATQDQEIRSVVLTANGRAFCAGVDLSGTQKGFGSADGDASVHVFIARILALTVRLETFPKPVIAAVNGIAVAGGFELVLACDLVVAAASAKLGDAHANFGLVPGAGGSVRLTRRVGVGRAKFLIFSGDFLSAQQMEQWGIVNQVVPDDELDAAVIRLTQHLARKSLIGLKHMKELINDGVELPLADALENEQRISQLHAQTWDRNEGLAAFNEKRAPVFTGK